MIDKLPQYNKFIVAAVGAAAMLVNSRYGVDITGEAQGVWTNIVAILTAFGVWAVPNK